jgi:hypothetical protein
MLLIASSWLPEEAERIKVIASENSPRSDDIPMCDVPYGMYEDKGEYGIVEWVTKTLEAMMRWGVS